MPTIAILGRQPAIGLSELESLYSAARVTAIADSAALLDMDVSAVDYARLGGTVKLCKTLNRFDTDNWQASARLAVQQLVKQISSLSTDSTAHKTTLGISTYGFDITPTDVQKTGLILKRKLREQGVSMRLIPNTDTALNTAQFLHNNLSAPFRSEVVFIKGSGVTYLAEVISVQDIDAYTLRDRGRPRRDAFVGMLPPKLAQLIINLAVGEVQTEHKIILDPFCGTGVILQEAALMGYDTYGTDISEKMIEYSRANLEWLRKSERLKVREFESTLAVADATTYTWDFPRSTLHALRSNSIAIATEAYLGRPIGGQQPTLETLQRIIAESNTIVQGFFKNIAPQLPTGSRLCVAVPAWFVANHVYHLPVVAELASLGYRRVGFAHVSPDELIYRRDDQITARELLVLEKTR